MSVWEGAECRHQVLCIYTVPFLFRYRRGQRFGVRPALFSPPHQVVRVAVLSGFAGSILQAAAEPVSQSGTVSCHERRTLKPPSVAVLLCVCIPVFAFFFSYFVQLHSSLNNKSL